MNIFACFVQSEPAAEFTHHLSDFTGAEGEDIEMYVELSKPDVPVAWMKNRKPLKPSDRIKILCQRYRQVLHILDAIPEDDGDYTVCLPDKSESTAILKIKGKNNLFLFAIKFTIFFTDSTVAQLYRKKIITFLVSCKYQQSKFSKFHFLKTCLILTLISQFVLTSET